MATALLDILDSDLCLHFGDRQVCSPGYALLEGDAYRFGESARGSARRQPRYISTRFWWQLGTQPLQPALGPARHTADLVHAHLIEVHRAAGEPEKVVLAVPDSLGRDQLALLLGIARTCPFQVVGLVNRSVLAAEPHADAPHVFHLELQLHQALLTHMEVADGQLRLLRSHALPGSGLLALQEAIVERIARAFIHNTRFDPRRKAGTEQILYDGLFDTLEALQSANETQIDINGYSTRISVEEMAPVADRLRDAVEQETRDTPDHALLLDPQACLIPGLSSRLRGARAVDRTSMPESLARHSELILQPPEDLHLLKGLPASPAAGGETSTATPGTAPRPAAQVPTHLLHDARAHPLPQQSVTFSGNSRIRRAGSGCWVIDGDAKVNVNGMAYDGTALETGDEIRVGSDVWLLIEVGG
ncbi:MAG: hypothetical protein ABR578_00475 [Chromatocurvus sp.]